MDFLARTACKLFLKQKTKVAVAVALMLIPGVLISSIKSKVKPKRPLQFKPTSKHIIEEYTRGSDGQEPSEADGTFGTSLTQIEENRLYLFSAILKSMTKLPQTDESRHDLVLVGWRHKDIRSVTHKCCAWLQNGDIVAVKLNAIGSGLGHYEAIEFTCSVSHASTVRGVSMIEEQSDCPRTPDVYLVPYYPGPAMSGLAVCSKISFWAQDAKFLVEWFEIVKLLGVSKVISYTYELNDDAMKVLQYYESTGFADVYAFDYPDKGSRKIATPECWGDKEVVVSDCAERMSNYQYASIMDKDEIIVPEKDDRLQGSLIRFLVTRVGVLYMYMERFKPF